MKPSFNLVKNNIKNHSRLLSILLAVLLISALILTLVFSGANSIAFAEDEITLPTDEITPPAEDEGTPSTPTKDTFSVVFPTVSYFQSDNPTLISANDDYLIVYDESASALFVRMNGRAGTYSYPLDISNIQTVKAVGKTAFIYADKLCYTIDLTDTAATPVQRELPTPDNANYFRSDGKYLYAKSSFGFISVYDENLDIAFGIDNEVYIDSSYASVFAGMQPLAGENGLIYYFPSILGSPYYIVYDPTTGTETVRTQIDCLITEAFVGEIIYAKVNNGTASTEDESPLVGLDKTTGKILFSSDIIPDSFCAAGDMLYTIEGKQIVTYALDKSDDGEYIGFKKVSTISMAGSDNFHLNGPSDLIKFDGKLVVADTLNKRLGYINSASLMTTLRLDSAPVRLTADSTGIYILNAGGNILKCEGEQITQTYETEGVIDIAYLDKLYILKHDGLYTALAGGIYKLADIDGATRVTCAKDGTNIYVLASDSIYVFAKDGILLNTMPCEFDGAVDFAVDYAGQITVLYSDRIENYTNAFGTLEFASKTEFYSATAHVSANALCLDGNGAYFTADECLVGKTSVAASTKDTYEPKNVYTPSGSEAYHFAKLKADVKSYIIPADGRMENITSAPMDTLIVLDGIADISENLAVALLKGKMMIITKADYEVVETSEIEGNYVTISDTTFYALPDINNGKLEVAEGTRIIPISDCADYDGGMWWRVSYDDSVYFVKAEACEEYKYLIPEEDKLYGKAKATRIGGLVNIYTEASTESPVVKQIVDGTDVEVLEEADGFYLVRHGEEVGYMIKDEVQIGGLTTVQIVAIVLAVFVLIAGTCIFIAIYLTRKKAEEESRRKDR